MVATFSIVRGNDDHAGEVVSVERTHDVPGQWDEDPLLLPGREEECRRFMREAQGRFQSLMEAVRVQLLRYADHSPVRALLAELRTRVEGAIVQILHPRKGTVQGQRALSDADYLSTLLNFATARTISSLPEEKVKNWDEPEVLRRIRQFAEWSCVAAARLVADNNARAILEDHVSTLHRTYVLGQCLADSEKARKEEERMARVLDWAQKKGIIQVPSPEKSGTIPSPDALPWHIMSHFWYVGQVVTNRLHAAGAPGMNVHTHDRWASMGTEAMQRAIAHFDPAEDVFERVALDHLVKAARDMLHVEQSNGACVPSLETDDLLRQCRSYVKAIAVPPSPRPAAGGRSSPSVRSRQEALIHVLHEAGWTAGQMSEALGLPATTIAQLYVRSTLRTDAKVVAPHPATPLPAAPAPSPMPRRAPVEVSVQGLNATYSFDAAAAMPGGAPGVGASYERYDASAVERVLRDRLLLPNLRALLREHCGPPGGESTSHRILLDASACDWRTVEDLASGFAERVIAIPRVRCEKTLPRHKQRGFRKLEDNVERLLLRSPSLEWCQADIVLLNEFCQPKRHRLNERMVAAVYASLLKPGGLMLVAVEDDVKEEGTYEHFRHVFGLGRDELLPRHYAHALQAKGTAVKTYRSALSLTCSTSAGHRALQQHLQGILPATKPVDYRKLRAYIPDYLKQGREGTQGLCFKHGLAIIAARKP